MLLNRICRGSGRAPAGLAAALALLAVIVAPFLPGCTRPTPPTASVPAGPVDPIPPIRPVSLEERQAYVGSQECVSCHPDLAGQLQSHHARTLAPVGTPDDVRFRTPAGTHDNAMGARLATAVVDGKHLLIAKKGTREQRIVAEWALGSGSRGVTYLGTNAGRPVELRLSYFSRKKQWALTPGQQIDRKPAIPVGRLLTEQERQDCLVCHSTALVQQEGVADPAQSILGVGCETCHGPGRAHAEAARRGDRDLRMAKLSDHRPEVATRLCGSCHRAIGGGDPEDPFVQAQMPRFQALALSQSKCFRESGGKLTCVTCHNPHRNAEPVKTKDYRAICLSCHTPGHARQVACKARPAGDCVSCHMPLQEVFIPTRPQFNTHLIKVWKKGEKPSALAEMLSRELGEAGASAAAGIR
jgi:predicted CXXCH cytochrome family protein